jgi:hypothetical protein
MEFNFYNDENIKTIKPSSVKAINNKIFDPNGKKISVQDCGLPMKMLKFVDGKRVVYQLVVRLMIITKIPFPTTSELTK